MNGQPSNRRFGHMMLAAFALTIPACSISSDDPPSDPHKAKADEELLGAWENPNPDPQVFCKRLTVEKLSLPGYPPGAMKVIIIPGNPDNAPTIAVCFSTELNGKKFVYYCNEPVEDPKHFPTWDQISTMAYGIHKYEVRAAALTLWGASSGLAKAVEAGKLKGKWAGGRYYSYIRLTDTTANLAKFLSSDEGDALFSKEGVLKRVK